MFVTVCVYIFACLHAHARICVVARMGMRAYVRTLCVCVCVCVHVYTRARVCASVRAKGEKPITSC